MIEFNVPLPPAELYCTTCGTKAVGRVKLAGVGFRSENGKKWVYLKAKFRCPRFPHKIIALQEYEWSSRFVGNAKWDRVTHYD